MEEREEAESSVPGTESVEAGGPLPGIEDEGVDAACDGGGKRLERGASLLEDIRKELDSESSPAPSPQPNRRAGMDLAAGEGGPGGVDRRAGKVVRGGSLLQEQLSLAIDEEDGAEEGGWDGAERRRRGIAAFDASKLGDMIAREEAKGVERMSYDVAQFLGTRASKVSAESVGGMDLVLWSGTWNVANKSPGGDLDDWLSISSLGAEAVSADMYIVGLQEVDTSVQSAVMLETRRGQQWKDYIDSCMRRLSAGAVREEQHVRVAVRQMGSVLLCVYAKAVHMQHIAEISTAIVTVGLLGVMGNKGAVAARMRLYGKTMCAVCAHLAAGESGDAYERRIADYVEINDKVMFNACAVQVMSGGQQPMYFTPPLTIGSHKVIVWVGDLNFRVKCGYKEAVEMSRRGEYAGLRGKDELMMAMAEGRVFRDFDEGVLDFAPTYKFDEGSKEYDTSSKLRVPSWTDRVLWKGNSMRLLDYSAMHNILVSDHRPVRAVIALVSLKDASVKSPDEGRHYQVSAKRGVVDAIASNPLVRWGSAQFQNMGDVIGDTADSSTEAIGGILATLGIAPYSEGDRAVRGSRLDAAAVTHENFEDVASDRLRIVLESEKLEWTDARELDGVRVQVADAGGGSGVLWLKGEVSVAAGVDSVVKVLKDPLARSDWDQTFDDGGIIQRFDEDHHIVRLVRSHKGEPDASQSPTWDWSLLQSRHSIAPASGGSDKARQAVIWQSVQHRLIPQNHHMHRGHLGFDAYLLCPSEGGGTNITQLLREASFRRSLPPVQCCLRRVSRLCPLSCLFCSGLCRWIALRHSTAALDLSRRAKSNKRGLCST